MARVSDLWKHSEWFIFQFLIAYAISEDQDEHAHMCNHWKHSECFIFQLLIIAYAISEDLYENAHMYNLDIAFTARLHKALE